MFTKFTSPHVAESAEANKSAAQQSFTDSQQLDDSNNTRVSAPEPSKAFKKKNKSKKSTTRSSDTLVSDGHVSSSTLVYAENRGCLIMTKEILRKETFKHGCTT